MSKESLLKAIHTTNSKLFTIIFKKKDGTVRTMYAKTGVKRFMSKNPSKRKYTVKDNNVIRVLDKAINQYRAIDINSVLEFRCGRVIIKENVQ